MVADDRLTEQGKSREVTGRVSRRQDDQLYSYFAKDKKGNAGKQSASSRFSGNNTAHPLTYA